ncbi:ribosome silencing factor [Collinsella tanakaei]|uniref:ribosome silencing factor n=1 Tax=Collinsella tanakaei TaxID=626935 RepID=UPI00195D289D|nr:ribosome silencing factor [Collinsella tanakaei]MBM6778039.1 ribosome silencing factor [Collinsella tanakaei]
MTEENLNNTENVDEIVEEASELNEADATLEGFGISADRTAASASSHGIEAIEVARVAAYAASEKKADDIVVLDLTELSDICDYFVIATGSNRRLADAVIDEVEERVAKSCNEHPFSIEGRDEGSWILMDYGSVLVHVFTPEARDYYRLEKLWGDAPTLSLDLS